MKNPFSKFFTPDYELNLQKALEEKLYDARRGLMIAVEAKQRADATLQYSQIRVQSLITALAEHKGEHIAKVPNPINISTAANIGDKQLTK